mgnify:CR=1 FL=1
MKCCHSCGTEWFSEKKQPGVKEYCEKCTAYLHACVNCRFHKPSAHNQCAIPNTDWVGDRTGCNFCDEFEFKDAELAANNGDKEAKARDALETILGPDQDGGKRPASFDDLFGDD